MTMSSPGMTGGTARWPTPPAVLDEPDAPPSLVLCADGGGSKVCVVIRTPNGVEVRGTAGPSNIVSAGYGPASQAILLATYRALSVLPSAYLPKNLFIPPLPDRPSPSTTAHNSRPTTLGAPETPFTSRPASPDTRARLLPSLNVRIFASVWLGLAGVSTSADAAAFAPFPSQVLNVPRENILITNDVNLLAAPALSLPGIEHVLAVVCGTGTVGRTLRIDHSKGTRQLPLDDVGVSRGWGYLLCDEGSAFWLGRLAIRALLFHADRRASCSIHSSSPPPLLPFHQDLLAYFKTTDPMDLIDLVSLTGRWVGPNACDPGELSSRRNATVAGAARVVLRWAFPDDGVESGNPPSPPASATSPEMEVDDPIAASQQAAFKLAQKAIRPLIELTLDLLGDRTVVDDKKSCLALGGGLMLSKGYRGLLLDGLREEGVSLAGVQVVSDAAGVGALGLAGVEYA